MYRISIICCSLLLGGCTLAAQYIGATGATLQLAQTIDITKTAIDAVSTIETGKPILDHVSSDVLDKDCNTFRLFKGESICIEKDRLLLKKAETLNIPWY